MTLDPLDGRSLRRAELAPLLAARIDTLRRYLESRIPASLRPELTADDILQEVWLAAYRACEHFTGRGPDSFDRWLHTLAHARLIDAVRRARRLKRGANVRYTRPVWNGPTSFTGICAYIEGPQPSPSQQVHLVETAHRILIALESLAPRQRAAVELRFLHGCALREIAQRLETTESAAKGLLGRGLALLRTMLGSASRYFTDVNTPEESH